MKPKASDVSMHTELCMLRVFIWETGNRVLLIFIFCSMCKGLEEGMANRCVLVGIGPDSSHRLSHPARVSQTWGGKAPLKVSVLVLHCFWDNFSRQGCPQALGSRWGKSCIVSDSQNSCT